MAHHKKQSNLYRKVVIFEMADDSVTQPSFMHSFVMRSPMECVIFGNILSLWNSSCLLNQQFLLGTCVKQEHPKIHGFSDLLEEKNDIDFFRNMRLRRETFNSLLGQFQQKYNLQDLGGRKPIPPKTCLYLVLWYLGNKATYREIGELFGLSEGAVHHCVQIGISAICGLGQKYILWPSHQEAQSIEKSFQKVAGFPGVIGAIDGCHIEIKAPENVQADFIDRTARHSVNLMAVCNNEKKFTFINAGYPGSAHDSQVFKSTVLYRKICENATSVFPSGHFHIIGDSAFELSTHVLVPYKDFGNLSQAERKYNTKLAQTRHVIENAFAFLKGRFRRLKFIDAEIGKIPDIIQACCILHNVTLGFSEEENFLLAEGPLAPEAGSETGGDADVMHFPNDVSGLDKRNYVRNLL